MIETNTITVQGINRQYSSVLRGNGTTVVLLLHSAAGTGKSALIQGGWQSLTDYSIVAPWGWQQYPEKSPAVDNATCWSSDEEPVVGREVDDVLFIDAVLDVVFKEREFKHIVLVGHSNGCAMGFKLLIQSKYKDKFVAASLYGAPWACEKMDLNVPILYMTADSDPIRPLNGGARIVTPWFSLTPTPVGDTINACINYLGCISEDYEKTEHVDYSVRVWKGRQHLEYWIFKNQGHHWPTGNDIPDAIKKIVGPVNLNINATKITLDFLNRVLDRQKN